MTLNSHIKAMVAFASSWLILLVYMSKPTTFKTSTFDRECHSHILFLIVKRLRNLKLEHGAGCEKSSDKFDIGHYPVKIKVNVGLKNFLHLPQVSGPIAQLVCTRKLI